MEKFCLKNISAAENQNLEEGIFIILLGASTIPPHLLLSVHGSIYSITEDGMQMASPLGKLLKFIDRKKIPTLFVEWVIGKDYTDFTDYTDKELVKLKSEIKKNISFYKKVVPGKTSCLFPIRDTVSAVHGEELLKANFIFELLPMMEKINAIGKVFSMNMEMVSGEFELLTYDSDELKNAIISSKITNQ